MNSLGTVLLIEDNAAEARLVMETLGERFGSGVALHAASTLDHGLRWLAERPADMILLDLTLPDSHGLATFHRVREQAPRTPVVILTGHDDDALALDAVRAGAADYLAKQHAEGSLLARTMRHVMERCRAERALRDSESRYRAIVETAEEGIVQLDAVGTIRFANSRLATMAGVSADSLPGRPWLELVEPTYRQLAQQLIVAAEHGPRRTVELRLMRGAATPLWTLAAVGLIRGADADSADAVVMLTDISGRALLEQELVRVARNLERRVEERTAQLAAAQRELQLVERSLARALRPPVQSVIALASRREPDPLPRILDAARAVDARIAALLALPELALAEPRRTTIDLSELAAETIDELRRAEPQRDIEVTIEPRLIDDADRDLVRRLLQCLFANAWQCTAATPRARLQFGRVRAAAGQLEYVVADNGRGLPAQLASRLFSARPQALGTSSGFGGIGIGLATAQRVVERHGGSIRAESHPGAGARFFFTLAARPEGRSP